MPHVLGTIEVCEQQTSWEVVLESSELVVFWAANSMLTLRNAWTSTDQHGIDYLRKLKESEANLKDRVVCDILPCLV